MTFTEAALEVLRTAGEPLHYKRITELAIERNLLSHVGKTPEVTMSSRLAMMVKKDRGQAPITKVKPGVFAIREEALKDFAAAVAAAAAIEAESSAPAITDEAVAGSAEAPISVSQKPPALPGADVFPEEEGDDDPILAGLEQEPEGTDKNGRRRRRRRRRGKGGDTPIEGGAPRNEQPPRNEPVVREPPRDFGRDFPRDGRDRSRDNRDRPRDQREPRGEQRGEPRGDQRGDFRRDETAQLDWNRAPADGDLLGKDLADAVWFVLSRGEHVAHGFPRVAELLVRRGRLSGNPAGLAPTIAASVRADIARAEQARARPRFRLRGGRVSLSEWQLSKQLVRAEQDLLGAADRYGAELRRTLINRLSDLPIAGFAELVATWLNTEGVTALRAVRRPDGPPTELHFAGTLKRGSEETRLAIVVLRGSREATRENVIDVRGALHHYGQASNAWLVTTGRITSGAREEAAMPGAAPIALFDGMALATAMERLGVAVRSYAIVHNEIDFELLEGLGDTPEQRERREREAQQRDREARGDFGAERPERGERGGRGNNREQRTPTDQREEQTAATDEAKQANQQTDHVSASDEGGEETDDEAHEHTEHTEHEAIDRGDDDDDSRADQEAIDEASDESGDEGGSESNPDPDGDEDGDEDEDDEIEDGDIDPDGDD